MRGSITLTLSGPVYSHAWQVLHQVEGGKESGGGREGEREEGEREEGESDGATSTVHATVTMWEFILKGFFETVLPYIQRTYSMYGHCLSYMCNVILSLV